MMEMLSLLAEGILAYTEAMCPFSLPSQSSLGILPSQHLQALIVNTCSYVCPSVAICRQGCLSPVTLQGHTNTYNKLGPTATGNEWKNVFIMGWKENKRERKQKTRMDHRSFHHGKVTVLFFFFHFLFLTGKVLCCHFKWQNVGSNFCPFVRSAPHRDKNTWICFTISVFVPGRKGYFCLIFAGPLKAGTTMGSQAVSKWQV